MKLYSHRAIYVGTFLGGPLAAGILIRRNFINTGKFKQGRNALLIGIVAEIVLFAVLFSIPEGKITKPPTYIIPLVYTLLAYWSVEKFQGFTIRRHQLKGMPFYSAWRLVWIVVISLLISVPPVLTGRKMVVFMDFVQTYASKKTELDRNENEARRVLTMLNNHTSEELITYINDISLPALQKNLLLLDELDQMKKVNKVGKELFAMYRQYYQMEINELELIRGCASGTMVCDTLQMRELKMQMLDLYNKIQALKRDK